MARGAKMIVNTRAGAFQGLRSEFKAKTRNTFLNDIEGQIDENAELADTIDKRPASIKYLTVTFDRWPNDASFSYTYFDFLLLILDRASGGIGIYKPVNQVRALRWNGTRSSLLRAIRYFGRLDPRLRVRRLLVLPFPLPTVGFRIDPGIHMK